MFVFRKRSDNETSARPLLGADPDQCLQTSSHFLNTKNSGRSLSPSRFSPIKRCSSPIFLHHRSLLIAGSSATLLADEFMNLRSKFSILFEGQNSYDTGWIYLQQKSLTKDLQIMGTSSIERGLGDDQHPLGYVANCETADIWSTSSAAEACRCGPQTADVLASKKQTPP
ncbi:hypothetical protein LXL04_001046 [Taraxacum kok-saghyz]